MTVQVARRAPALVQRAALLLPVRCLLDQQGTIRLSSLTGNLAVLPGLRRLWMMCAQIMPRPGGMAIVSVLVLLSALSALPAAAQGGRGGAAGGRGGGGDQIAALDERVAG